MAYIIFQKEFLKITISNNFFIYSHNVSHEVLSVTINHYFLNKKKSHDRKSRIINMEIQ